MLCRLFYKYCSFLRKKRKKKKENDRSGGLHQKRTKKLKILLFVHAQLKLSHICLEDEGNVYVLNKVT